MKIEFHPLFFWILWSVLFLLVGLIAFTSFHEYVNVAINNNIAEYHFGSEGPYSDFEHYKTADAYVHRMLFDSVVAMSIVILLLLCAIKRSGTGLILLTAFSLGFGIFLAI